MKIKMLLFFLLIGGFAFAQERSAAVEQAVRTQTERYQLTPAQVEEMYVIEARRERNLNELEQIRESDPRLYLEKKRSIRLNSEGSIRRILDPRQRQILQQEQAAYRTATSNLIREMRQAGKSKEEIEMIILERG